MKILWFTSTPCGATEILTGHDVTGGGWLYTLSQALKECNHIELHIAFYWGVEMKAFKYDGICYHPILRDGYESKVGRYIYRLKQQFMKSLDCKEISRCLAVYNQVNPDIVHFHGSEENYGLVAKHINNKKCVLSIQGILSPIYYKLYSGIQRDLVLRSENIIFKLLLDGYAAKDRIMRQRVRREVFCLKTIPNIIGRTNWDFDVTLSINPNRRYFICNEIIRKEFMSVKYTPIPFENKIILTTTISYGIYKGLEMVYETARLLTNVGVKFEWNVIGIENNSRYERLIRNTTRITPSMVNINLLGRKNAEQIIETLCKSHCFIQVSHIENSPNSLCEAMILGMPIIASYAGGTSSMLEDGKEGILVQDGDPYRLAGAIINLSRNYDVAINMGYSARKRALVRHSPENVVVELLTAYNKIIN